VRSHRS